MRVDETNLQFRIGFLIIVLDVDLILGETYRRKALALGRDETRLPQTCFKE